ncbi:MAG: glycosyltransferase family 2 protein [Thermodesulfovibrionales bacterium]|nr:glycosyltransferase family 2 protein [Thermodesulfovibrionales bacterium]
MIFDLKKFLIKSLSKGDYLIKISPSYQIKSLEMLVEYGTKIPLESYKVNLNKFGRFDIDVNLKNTPSKVIMRTNGVTEKDSFFKKIVIKRTNIDLEGSLDGVIDDRIAHGWCRDAANPERRLLIQIVNERGDKLGEGIANLYREDLEKAGIGDGRYAFKIDLKVENISEGSELILQEKTSRKVIDSLRYTTNYQLWIEKYEKPFIEKIIKKAKDGQSLIYKPKISLLMTIGDISPSFLKKTINSVTNQIYPNWELCIAYNTSLERAIGILLDEFKSEFPEKIKVTFREKKDESICEANNAALALATGEYIALLNNLDELTPHALYLVVETLNDNPNLKIIYSDEDKIDELSFRSNPHFKPDWSPDLLLSFNYVSNLLVIKKEIFDKIGGFRIGTEGSQNYDIVLRASLHCKDSEIFHIPHVLYHSKVIENSPPLIYKDCKEESAIKVIEDYLFEKGVRDFTVTKGKYINTYKVSYLNSTKLPLVSVIVPTKDKSDLLEKCIKSIIRKTNYPSYEIIIVNHDSELERTYKLFNEICSISDKIRVLKFSGEFNFSLINNFAVHHAKGDLFLFLNNDTEVINREWMSEMANHAVREEIGCVGAKLYYPDGTIQHGGVILGVGGVAGHSHRYKDGKDGGYFGRLSVVQNLSAVTAACMMVKKKIFYEVGGFDAKNLKIAYNDIDFCLKVRERGYRNLWTPYAELYHYESKSRGSDNAPENIERYKKEIEFMKKKWGELLLKDPYYNPNLTLEKEDFSVKIVMDNLEQQN